MRRALALCLALLAAPAGAETLAARPDLPFSERLATEARDIGPAEWRRMVEGRTVWYRIGPVLWGREHYHPGTNRITFQFTDGTCVEAVWDYADPWYCFDFGPALEGAGPHCFRHLEHEGRLFALGRGGEPQEIDRIDGAPLSCGPAPSS